MLLVGVVALSGCAAGGEPPSHDPGSQGAVVEETGPHVTVEEVAIPGDLPADVPMPDYEVIAVMEVETGGYMFTMRGTDVEADAAVLESMLMDAGFHRLAWGLKEDRGYNGIFITEGSRVRVAVQEVGDGVEIEYEVGERADD